MRRISLLLVVVSLLASACIAGGDNVVSTGPTSTNTTGGTVISGSSTTSTTTEAPEAGSVSSTVASTSTTTTTVPNRPAGIVTADTVYEPWGEVVGLTMFRGNPTRTYFGSGRLPDSPPAVAWRFPDQAMAGLSPVGQQNRWWTGTGWTGQPVVWERPDGVTEVIFGAYDKKIHFVDAETGDRTRPDYDMGDIIKGSVSLDPDGYPLLYAGSRDPRFRIIALDEEEPYEVWSLHARDVEGIWNDDWDSNPVVVDDVLYIGGENSWWYAVKLNRSIDPDGKVRVDPRVVFQMPAWTDELFDDLGRQHSIENSTAVFEQSAYFATSGGRVVGVDVSDIENGNAEVFFDFWVGDDIDSTITIDDQGFVYVVAHADHAKSNNKAARRIREVGHLLKLDTSQPGDDAIVWSQELPAARGQDAGAWATPALHPDGLLFVPTDAGDLQVYDTSTGDLVWDDFVGGNAWSSPVIVEDRLVIAVNCLVSADQAMRVYDLTDPRNPEQLYDVKVGDGCIESTPAVWRGHVFVGSRDGFFYALES